MNARSRGTVVLIQFFTPYSKRYEVANFAEREKVDIHVNVLGRYERGDSNPSIEVAYKLADVLNVSLDYLVGKTELLIDEDVTDRILTIQKLPDSDREHIMFALDALIRDAKARLAYS